MRKVTDQYDQNAQFTISTYTNVHHNGECMINLGLIGAGFMGETHANALIRISSAHVKWVVDRDYQRAEYLAEKIDAIPTCDINEVLLDPEVDVCDITLPTVLHASFTINALNHGKHVIVEKPISLNIPDAEEMISTAKKNNRYLFVGHVLRFFPEYYALHQLIKSNRLGNPLLAHAYRLSNMPQWSDWFKDPQKTGGAVLDLQIHDIDFLNWIFGQPSRVFAVGFKDSSEGWNSLYSIVQYGDASASFEVSYNKPVDYPFTCGIRVQCTRGEIEYHSRAKGASFEKAQPEKYLTIHEDRNPDQKILVHEENAFYNELSHFIDCIRGIEDSPRVTADDAFLALLTAKAIESSLINGVQTDI